MKLITKIYRGSVVESFHLGYAYVTDETGKELFSAGNPDTPVFTQETASFFKTAAILQEKGEEKFKLTDKELAVTCSTHSGKDIQTDVIHSLLKKINLKISDLKCKIQTPDDISTYEKMIIQGRRPSQIHNKFSGLHAGMLTLAKCLEERSDDYLLTISLTHTNILQLIKKYSGLDKILTETDNSGLDTYFMPLNKIANMYNHLLTGSDENLSKIFQAITKYPELIAGEETFDTEFTKIMKGNGIVKSGSNGLVALCLKPHKANGITIVVKAIDGSPTAAISMAIEIMNHLQIIDKKTLDKLKKFHIPEFTDTLGKKTGYMQTEISK